MSDAPRLAVVVVSFEARETLLAGLDVLRAHASFPLELVVVDNASTDGSADAVRARHPEALVIANAENVGFARACNQGWRASRAPHVLFLNPDAEVTPGAVETLVGLLEEPAGGRRRRAPHARLRRDDPGLHRPRPHAARRAPAAPARPGRRAARRPRPRGGRGPPRARARARLGVGVVPRRPAHGPRGRRRLRRALLPLRGGRRPVPPPARGRLARRLHSRRPR